MKITCNIIRDLLPLYAEDLVSEDTRVMVDEHLRECEDCTNVLNEMKKSSPVPVEAAPESLNKVKKTIRRRRVVSVMAAVLTVITIASFVFTYLFTPFQLTKEQALDDFYIREDGAVVIDYSPYVIGRSLGGYEENWFIHQYSTRYDMWKGDHRKSIEELFGSDGVVTEEERRRYENIDVVYGTWQSADGKVKSDAPIPWIEDAMLVSGGNDWNWWYFDPTGMGNDTLLYDAGQKFPEKEDRMQFAPIYPMIFFGSILGVLVLLVWRKLTKKNWAKELATRVGILLACLVLSTLFVSNGRIFTAYVGVIDQYWGWFIPMNTVFLSLTALFWRQLYLLNRQDKGE